MRANIRFRFLADMIEIEDQRLATVFQVATTRDKHSTLKPYLDGFNLTQLTDKINAECLAAKTDFFSIGYRGTCSTFLYLAKYLAVYFPHVKLVGSIEKETLDALTHRRIMQDNPNVAFFTTEEKLTSYDFFEAFAEVDIIVLAPFYDYRLRRFRHFFDEWAYNTRFRKKKFIVVDTVHARKYDPRGEYYLGSCVWVSFDWHEVTKIMNLAHSESDKKPQITWNKSQPAIDGIVAVTSLSPLPKHIEVQKEVIASWKRLGLNVISGNSADECSVLAHSYPDVTFKQVGLSSLFSRPTPRIYDLMRLGDGLPTLLINSDIAIYGDQQLLRDSLAVRKPFVGVRYNWKDWPGNCKRELWGIDAFMLFPEQIKTFPNLDLAIGFPFWDYWLPYHLEQSNFDFDWVGKPYFYHQDHAKYWDEVALETGKNILRDYYGTTDWDDWRRSKPYGSMI